MLPKNPNLEIDYSQYALKEIYFAGGCFWGTDAYLARVKGVCSTEAGYANGNTENPSYEEVCKNNTGHAETVKVLFAPELINLRELTRIYFGITDPTSLNKQAGDTGTQYRVGVYYTDKEDEPVLRELFAELQKNYDKPIVTELLPLENYYPAEEYHQDYLEKNPGGYCHVSFDGLE